jgi:hypothetical protein
MSKFIRRDENSIDKLFRQKLQDAEEPTPLYLWEGVRQRSAPKRRFLWWWFAGAVVALGLITWAVSGQFENNTSVVATASEVVKPDVTDKNITESTNAKQTNSTEAIASEKSNQSISSSDNKAVAATADQTSIQSSGIKKQRVFAPKKDSQKKSSRALPLLKDEITYPTEPLVQIAQLGDTSTQLEIPTGNVGGIPTENTHIESADPVADVVEAFQSNPPLEEEQNIKAPDRPVKSDSIPNANTSRFALSLGAYCLAGKPQGVKNNKELNQVVSSARSSFNHDPKNFSLGVGLFGSIETRKHFTLQLGFDIQKVTSKVELTNVEIGEVLVTSITPDSTFIENFVPTYTFQTTVFQSNYMLYNTYLLVGKDFHWRKVYFGIQTGPVLRFNTVTKALPETYNDSTYVIYPQGKRMDLQASAQFGVLLNDHLNLLVHFQQRWMLPVWKSNDSRMVHPAIGLGVSYKFH